MSKSFINNCSAPSVGVWSSDSAAQLIHVIVITIILILTIIIIINNNNNYNILILGKINKGKAR